jgi:hypothetical protein
VWNNEYRYLEEITISSPTTIRMIKSRKMRWAGHVASMGQKRDAYRILLGKSEE